MDAARCTENGISYTAVDFSRLPSDQIANLRRFLVCPDCGGPAFFRRASRGGRAACFGARPHREGCELAAPEYDPDVDGRGEDQDQLLNPGNRIVVDLNQGAAVPPQVQEEAGLAANRGRRGRYEGDGARPQARMSRRLSSLLRSLIEVPAFRESEQILEIPGRDDTQVRDFFIALEAVTADHSEQYLGLWGMISDAQIRDGTLWLNSGGRRSISFCFGRRHIQPLYDRYGIAEEEDLSGAYILALARVSVSQRGKIYCDLGATENVILRLAR